jgi:hypothetical protein
MKSHRKGCSRGRISHGKSRRKSDSGGHKRIGAREIEAFLWLLALVWSGEVGWDRISDRRARVLRQTLGPRDRERGLHKGQARAWGLWHGFGGYDQILSTRLCSWCGCIWMIGDSFVCLGWGRRRRGQRDRGWGLHDGSRVPWAQRRVGGDGYGLDSWSNNSWFLGLGRWWCGSSGHWEGRVCRLVGRLGLCLDRRGGC